MATSEIKHVVYYMLENRSFDNLLGWIYDQDHPPKHIIAGAKQKSHPFYGLKENTYFNSFEGDKTKHYVKKGVSSLDTPHPDPHEEFTHVNTTLFGHEKNPKKNKRATMEGFLKDYATAKKLFGFGPQISKKQALQILDTYSPEQVPIISTLAKRYAVSDYWFSSVPSQTDCNRAFSICGTSLGETTNHGSFDNLKPAKFKTKTIWQTLTENGFGSKKDWMIYHQDRVIGLFSYIKDAFEVPNQRRHIKPIRKFFKAVEKGTLPSFSYIEPSWLGLFRNGNSYHPPGDVEPGEEFLKELYDKLRASKAWEQTLLVITFDEHGGTYDHVPPEWGATPPWGDGPLPPNVTLENKFKFNRFGVRVPTLLISPWIKDGMVFRSETDVPYDSTSFIATLLKWKKIPKEKWGLGERVANAPTFEGVLNRKKPRKDHVKLETTHNKKRKDPKNQHLNDLHALVLPRLYSQIAKGKLSGKKARQAAMEDLRNSSSVDDLTKRIKAFKAKYYTKRK